MSFPLQLARGCPAVVGQPRAAFILALGVTMALTTACAPTRQRVAPPGDGPMSRELRLGGLIAMENAIVDINRNNIHDGLDIAMGMSRDVNKNGMIDLGEGEQALNPFRHSALETASRAISADSIVLTADHFPDRQVHVYFFIQEEFEEVDLWVENASGRRVRTLLSARLYRGPHHVGWNKCGASWKRLPSGLYWITLRVSSGTHQHPVQWRD